MVSRCSLVGREGDGPYVCIRRFADEAERE
jgi:hypothetical protein